MSRHYCFTWFSDVAEPENIDWDKVRYAIYQKERCPRTGREHFQGYCQLFDKARYKKAAEWLGMPGVHLEKPKGSVEDNQRYCTKDDTRIGGPWEGGEAVTQGERIDLKSACALVREGKIDQVEDTVFVKFHKGLYQLALRNAPKRNSMPDVTVVWGPTGTGKSRYAEANTTNPYWHPGGRWWDGYITGQDVIIDDFDPKDWPVTEVLRLLDRYPLKVPFKGGYAEFNSAKIIITSHFDPLFWYPDRWEEIVRRIKIHNIRGDDAPRD